MLNISRIRINAQIDNRELQSLRQTGLSDAHRLFTRWLVGMLIAILIFMFLPWTQNIQSKGKVTTLRPEQRPQTIHATIAGRIEKWYVREGQLLQKGDTIAYLSEVKTEYFDPELAPRTARQVDAKEGAIGAYRGKAAALDQQVQALRSELTFKQSQLANKIRQVNLKIASDSIEVERARLDLEIAERQLQRTQALFDQGIKSLSDLEEKRLKKQEANAKWVAADNKLLVNRNELANARLDLETTRYEYAQKIAKTGSDRFSTLSELYDAEAVVNKLLIDSANYALRSRFYYITAPQDCYVTKALKPGIGETLKEGDPIVSIMPDSFDLAVELYIKPMDLPLVDLGQEVRFIFDGWPAIVFSGWPDQSFGAFSGRIVAIDNMISENGAYRVLAAPDPDGKPWPQALRPGSGAQGIALLGRVPVWYEIWRKLNGFPPDYYRPDATGEMPKTKAPVKSLK